MKQFYNILVLITLLLVPFNSTSSVLQTANDPQLMAEFDKAFDITMAHEGAYVNDPNDPGGETYRGVTRRDHPTWEGWNIIDKFSEQATSGSHFRKLLKVNVSLDFNVRNVYKHKYWDKSSLDKISSQLIANEIFDTGVNCGRKMSVKFFQRALNLLNNMQKDYPDILDDGGLGDISVATFNAYMGTANKYRSRSTQLNETVLLKALNGEQYMRYHDISEGNEILEKYFYGWVANRA